MPARIQGHMSDPESSSPATKSGMPRSASGDDGDAAEEDEDAEHQGERHEGLAHLDPNADEQDDEDERDESSLPCDGSPSPAKYLRAEPGVRGVPPHRIHSPQLHIMDVATIGPSKWSVGQPAEATFLLPLRPSCLPPGCPECLAQCGLRVCMEEQSGDPPPITDAQEDHRPIRIAERFFRRIVVDVAKRPGEPTDVADGHRAGT